jgi:integral membrane protein
MSAFIMAARVEGVSFLLLMGVAMPLKYGLGIAEVVKHTGRAHGLLVVVFLVLLVITARTHKWPARKVAWALLSSMIPLGWIFFEASDRLDVTR